MTTDCIILNKKMQCITVNTKTWSQFVILQFSGICNTGMYKWLGKHYTILLFICKMLSYGLCPLKWYVLILVCEFFMRFWTFARSLVFNWGGIVRIESRRSELVWCRIHCWRCVDWSSQNSYRNRLFNCAARTHGQYGYSVRTLPLDFTKHYETIGQYFYLRINDLFFLNFVVKKTARI